MAICIGLLPRSRGVLPTKSRYVHVVLWDCCGVWRSADPVCDQLEIKKMPSHLSHRRASYFSARLVRQGVAQVNDEDSNDLPAVTPSLGNGVAVPR